MKVSYCPNCGEKVVWLKTPKSRLIMLDAKSVKMSDAVYKHGVHVVHWGTCRRIMHERANKKYARRVAEELAKRVGSEPLPLVEEAEAQTAQQAALLQSLGCRWRIDDPDRKTGLWVTAEGFTLNPQSASYTDSTEQAYELLDYEMPTEEQ